MSGCAVEGCPKDQYSRGWCATHYNRWYRTGDPTPAPKLSAEERFFAKVAQPESCWLWTGYIDANGYGKFTAATGSTWLAHRWAYEFLVGEIPKGLTLDHLCRNRACVNPAHLEPVPYWENTARGDRFRAPQGMCMKGLHEMPAAATPGTRSCRECAKERRRVLARARASREGA